MGKQLDTLIKKQTSKLEPELISIYARQEGISYQESERRIKVFIDTVIEFLLDNHSVNLKGLGLIHVRPKKNSKYFNKRTGLVHVIPLLYYIRFRPSYKIKQAFNRKAKRFLNKNITSELD